jgi:hypothetical protein
MWTRITEDNWLKSIKEFNLSIFYQSDYLKSISQSFDLELNYFSFSKNNQVFSLVAFFNNKSRHIIFPEGFSYSSFHIQNNLSEKVYLDIITSLIKILKKDFKNIKFKLETNITDIRPFSWENFSIEVRYTHIKQNNLPPEKRVLKSLRKDYNSDYDFKFEELNHASLKLNLDTLRALSFSKTKINLHQKLLATWAERGYLKAFNLYRSNTLICSSLVLIDYSNFRVYIILINKVEKEFKNAHSFLYQQIISYCKENGWQTVDFCGANFKSISEFKSRFNTELKMYFMVSINNTKLNELTLLFKRKFYKVFNLIQ